MQTMHILNYRPKASTTNIAKLCEKIIYRVFRIIFKLGQNEDQADFRVVSKISAMNTTGRQTLHTPRLKTSLSTHSKRLKNLLKHKSSGKYTIQLPCHEIPAHETVQTTLSQ